jgi:ubiquitin-protein ligase
MAKRLGKEWKNLEDEPDSDDRFFPEIKNNDLEWVMKLLIGESESCCYAGGIYTVVLTFPSEYPFKPPVVKFTPAIYHPGISQETGEICADVLRDTWGPTRNVRWIMGVLYNMFLTEGADHAVEQEIMKQKEDDYEAFKAKVQAQIQSLME